MASIQREKIKQQLAALELQRQQLIQNVSAVDGGMILCRQWLKDLDEEEAKDAAEAAKRAAEAEEWAAKEAEKVQAETNGEAQQEKVDIEASRSA